MPSRISGACNGCRTKKQKCSGDRNGCTQCVAAGIVCTWPEQRKRGPAKGYIEGLEHRLHEAETLLLQLLPLVTPDQLSTATAALDTANGSGRDSPERIGRSSPPVLNKKTGIEYWESFPLDNVENIRRWQQDCAMHSQFRDHDLTMNGPGSSRGASRPSSVDLKREGSGAGAPASVGATVMPNRRSGNMTQYRSMSSDAFSSNQPEYMSATPTTSAPNWNGNTAYVNAQGYTGEPAWHPHTSPSGMGMQQQGHHHQQQMIAAGGAMDVDGGFFTSDVKRHLFW